MADVTYIKLIVMFRQKQTSSRILFTLFFMKWTSTKEFDTQITDLEMMLLVNPKLSTQMSCYLNRCQHFHNYDGNNKENNSKIRILVFILFIMNRAISSIKAFIFI